MSATTSDLEILETEVTIIGENARLEGKIEFDQVTRVHGVIVGEILSRDGSTLIIGESAWIDGSVSADTLFIDGYIRGDVTAKTRVVISGTGRVVGNIHAPALQLEPGSHFDGICSMSERGPTPSPPAGGRALKPA